MKQPKPYLSLYTYDQINQEIIHLSLNDREQITVKGFEVWESLLPIIEEKAATEKLIINYNKPDLKEPQIILLFLKSEHITNGTKFFDVLANGGGKSKAITEKLRPNVPPKDRLIKQKKKLYHPIITICYTDISTLNTEEKRDAQGKKEYEWNELTYRTFRHDTRVKILDSGIWHRYVPIYPFGSNFETVFEDVLKDITQYHKWGLYYTTAANVTLEFQMRMLENSFIANIGNGGHSEVVTPFKFHSEWQMKNKAQREIKDFLAKDWNGQKLMEALQWRALIVDDQAGSNNDGGSKISTIGKEPCKISKAELIRHPFDEIYGGHNKNNLQIEVSPEDDNILKYVSDKMEKKTYDLIFLDYLLGTENGNRNKREYGFRFLINLLDDNREDAPKFRRDFLGKYWIFPISSFPHALPDKLTQLGISHLHEIWHISQGGDPITTPHLYAHNLYRFLKQKVGKYFLYPSAMRSFFNQIPFKEDEPEELLQGIELLQQAINNAETRLKILDKIDFDDNTSPFVESIRSFVKDQFDGELGEIIENIKEINRLLLVPNAEMDGKSIVQKIKNICHPGSIYKDSLEPYVKRADSIVNRNQKKAEVRIREAITNKSRTLVLSGLGLRKIPLEIKELSPYIKRLILKENHLTELPDVISQLNELEEIDLSENHFITFPEQLYSLTKIERINVSSNDIKDIPIKELSNLKKLRELNFEKNPVPIAQKHLSSKKNIKEKLEYLSNKLQDAEGKSKFKYQVGISFAGEDRERVEKVVNELEKLEVIYFYDRNENLLGKDLALYLEQVFFEHCEYAVIFISEYYKNKKWTRFELRAIKAREVENLSEKEAKEYVIPVKLDDTKIPGILPITGYIDATTITPEKVAQNIYDKLYS